ncbi:carbamoyltransferase family protein [Actinomadura terrae]|uniref:carbamoyltransferase family protein n=1 Tax=Actinomadura terrae TaxID=604353 RepID=UPI001FA80A4C|nr:carbamoyltransferase N-terminal domain-containing protein [Actinomadura terrae]
MVILGISAFFHDSAAALLVDGELVAAAEEERFSRRKHDRDFPARAIAFCLETAGVDARDVDYVAFYERPGLKAERALTTILAEAPATFGPFTRFLAEGGDRLNVRRLISDAVGIEADRVLFVDHHLSHAASSFFASPFESAATLTVDGVGEWATSSVGEGAASWDGEGRNRLELKETLNFPHSLGLLYSAFTEFLGFRVNDGEYKVMGLAAYGTPRYREAISKVARLYDDGSLWLDMRYFRYHRSTRTGFHPRLADLLGVPPCPRDVELEPDEPGRRGELARRYADIAASLQRFTEDAVVAMARRAVEVSGQRRLCMAGGVALNGVANFQVLERAGVEELFIPSVPGDSGGSLGAALYVHHVLLGGPRRFVMRHASWGARHDDDAVARAVERAGLASERHDDPAAITKITADLLANGGVGGWFQGRFEFGPRALGNRSILADPRGASMKDLINRKVKFREPFRPFAPAMLHDRAPGYVAAPGAEQWPTRFMLLVMPLAEEFAASAPAVDHFGTGRIQTVSAEENPLFHSVIEQFQDRTGLGCVLNTSFNLRGEPIVATPQEAISTFERSGLDFLIMEGHVISRP